MHIENEETYILTQDEIYRIFEEDRAKLINALRRKGHSLDNAEEAVDDVYCEVAQMTDKILASWGARTRKGWIAFLSTRAKWTLRHRQEHEGRLEWEGLSIRELCEKLKEVRNDETLPARDKEAKTHQIQLQIKVLMLADDTKTYYYLPPTAKLEKEIVRMAIRKMIKLVFEKEKVIGYKREAFVAYALDELDSQHIVDMLDELHAKGTLRKIVFDIMARLKKYGRKTFARCRALVESEYCLSDYL